MKNLIGTQLKPTQHGYSLIELMTTIAVLIIVTVIIVPYASVGASPKGQSAARFAVSSILTAQMDAIATQGFRRVHFYSDGSGWCVEVLDQSEIATPFDPATATYAQDETESQGQGQQSILRFNEDNRYKDVTLEQISFDGGSTSVTFDPTGGIVAANGAPSTGGSFLLKSGAYSWRIQLAPLTGKVEVIQVAGVSQ